MSKGYGKWTSTRELDFGLGGLSNKTRLNLEPSAYKAYLLAKWVVEGLGDFINHKFAQTVKKEKQEEKMNMPIQIREAQKMALKTAKDIGTFKDIFQKSRQRIEQDWSLAEAESIRLLRYGIGRDEILETMTEKGVIAAMRAIFRNRGFDPSTTELAKLFEKAARVM